jgi:cytochrome c peroxidase
MKKLLVIPSLLLVAVLAWRYVALPLPERWSEQEVRLIQSLALASLPDLPPDSSNRLADDPAAAELGHRLYFDTRLSSNGKVACASCHQPELMFTDGLALAMGLSMGSRHTPSLVGIAYSPWFYWDGRKDSQWSQALAPLEAAVEHDTDRVAVLRLILADQPYRELYESLFGTLAVPDHLPDSASPLGNAERVAAWNSMETDAQIAVSTVFSNLGKALAAYQRQLLPGPARFDDYATAIATDPSTMHTGSLSGAEVGGLQLFLGKAQCASCHNGPLFTNHEFHNTGVFAIAGQLPPMGRYDGIRTAREDPFNCLGKFSDADASECIELRFARDENDLVGAQKTPTLRNVTLTAPYMHGGQFKTLSEVIQHYNDAPTSMLNHNEAKPLGLRAVEASQLEAFLHTLTAPLATDKKWLVAPDYE